MFNSGGVVKYFQKKWSIPLKVDGEMKETCLLKPLEGSSVVAKCILLI